MSTTDDFTTVTNSIAALTITGVTIKDSDEIPDAVTMSTPVLMPDTNGFVTNVSLERSEMTGQWNNLYYTLNYRYVHCTASGGLGGVRELWRANEQDRLDTQGIFQRCHPDGRDG